MIKIATYNLHFGGSKRKHQIAEVLHEIDADVIILTEASNPEVVETFGSELGMQTYIALGRKTSIAALTRSPVKNWAVFDPPRLGRPLLEVYIETMSGQLLTIFGLHLQCHFFKRNEKQRLHELTSYLDYIRGRNCGNHILLGDFNAVAGGDRPSTQQMPLKEKLMLRWEHNRFYRDAIALLQTHRYADCFRSTNPNDDWFTLPVHAPNIRLDYIFATSALAARLQNCQVHTTAATLTASDHFPIYASFDL